MRILIRGVVALVILLAVYWAWALAGAAQLASAAERGDADAVIERVDLQALIRSLKRPDRACLSRPESATAKTAASAGRLSQRLRSRDAAARASDAG